MAEAGASRRLGDARATPSGPQRVAVIIPAVDARSYVGATVRACRAIPGVDLVIVVDDGSADDTAQLARSAGAVAVRHSAHRGRASALETGVKVAAMRDRADWPPRILLFLDADLGDSAVEAAALVDAVVSGEADCALGIPLDLGPRRREDLVASHAVKALAADLRQPLSTVRALTRPALLAAAPFSSGHGVDIGVTLDLLEQGFTVAEIPCDFHHRADEPGSWAARRTRYWEIWLAARMRRRSRKPARK